MKTLIIGSRGMLGQELTNIVKQSGYDAVYADIAPGDNEVKIDITDKTSLVELVKEYKPEVIFNCSAFTDVDGAEEKEELANQINGYGAENLAIAAKECGALLVHVSTDYVFSGDADKPYMPNDPVDPQGAYGRSKLLGEQLIQNSGCKWIIIRTAWLFGPRGKNFVETIVGFSKKRDSLKVVDDQRGCPTWAPDLAKCMFDIAHTPEQGIFHFCNGPACTWYDLAKESIKQASVECEVNPCTSDEFPRPAKRPAWSVLDCSSTYKAIGWEPKSWQEAVSEYVAQLQ